MMTSEQQSNRQRVWQPGAETDTVSFGTWLRRQREVREISLREIADVTKISIRYLEALEQDRFDVLPAPVFAKGFLREYARYVGLDIDEVVNSYLTAQAALEPEEEPSRKKTTVRGGALERTSGLLLTLAVIVLLGIIAGLVYYMERSRTANEPEPPPIAAPPIEPVQAPARISEPESAAAIPLGVTIDFTGECWVEAVVDDDRRVSELHVAGESLRLEAQEKVVLTLGNPAAVRVEVNGRPFPIAVPTGTVAHAIEIDLAALESEDQ